MTGAFALGVHDAQGPAQRLQTGVELVTQLVDSCDHAGATIASRRKMSTAAASDDLARRGDALQHELDEGPCLDVVRESRTVISQDLSRDRRWPGWAPRVVAELGVHSMMSLLLCTQDDTFGALNLYGDRSGAWGVDDIAVAHALAEHLAVAVADAWEIDHLGHAMTNRSLIGQAEGIVMERFKITADQARAYLRQISQDRNRKLVAVADVIVRTGQLPDGPTGPERRTPDPSAQTKGRNVRTTSRCP